MYDGNKINIPTLAEDWMLPVFIASLILFAYLRIQHHKRLSKLFRSMSNVRLLKQVMREEMVFSHRASVLLVIVFFLNTALLFYFFQIVMDAPLVGEPGFSTFVKCLLIVTAIYAIKSLMIRIIKVLTDGDYGLTEYQFTVHLYNKALGLILLPLLLICAYIPDLYIVPILYTAAALFIIFYVIRVVRGIFNALSLSVTPFYIILYLCTLEILPLLVLMSTTKLRVT